MTPDHTKLMSSVIRASKEIVELKTILRRIKYNISDLEQILFDTSGIRATANEILLQINLLKGYVAKRMETVIDDVLFFDYTITHFTQKEMDRGYAIIEYAMSDGPEYFDDDGDFVQIFVQYVIFLHNGKIIPLTDKNIQVIRKEARPV